MAILGPVYPAPGGNTFVGSPSGSTVPIQDGGQNRTYSGLDTVTFSSFWWGLTAIGAAMDGVIDAAGETLTFQGFTGGDLIATWTGTTTAPGYGGTIYTKLTVTINSGLSGSATWTTAAAAGLSGAPDQVIDIDESVGGFVINYAFTASLSPTFAPSDSFKDIYDSITVASGGARTNSSGLFFAEILSPFTTGNDTVDLNSYDLTLFASAPNEVTDALDGDDVVTLSSTQNIGVLFTAGGGNDSVTGATVSDNIQGGTGDDTFIVTAATIGAGASYDGGADDDTLQVNGGGVIDVTGVTFTDIENAILTDVTGTEVTITTSQIASFTGNLDAQGADDTFVITDLAFLNTFGTPAARAAAFGLISGLLDGGVESVKWQEGGANNVATKIGANVVVASADPLGKTTGLSWNTSAFTFDGTTGDRLSKVTTMDDDSIVTRIFLADVVASDVTTNIAGAVDTTTVIYDGAGRADSRTITYDDGRITQYTYDNDNRVDTLMQTQSNGYSTTTSYNDSNQRTQVVSDDTASEIYTWKTSTLTFDPLTGQITEKQTVLDNDNIVTENYSGGLLISRITQDGGANEAFTLSTQSYNAGVFQYQSIIYDNGTGYIQGTSGSQTLYDNFGYSDAMIGGGGADTFVFQIGGLYDRVLDFSQAQGDLLDLTAFSVDEVSDITNYTQVGANLVIDFGGGDKVQINNMTYANLTNADLFVILNV